jgi:hypothetical protein
VHPSRDGFAVTARARTAENDGNPGHGRLLCMHV